MQDTNITDKNTNGSIKITNTALTTIIGKATTQNYGVVGMASRREFHDGLSNILNRQNYSKGIMLQRTKNNQLAVNIYVVIQYGVKISEVAKSIQKNVKYELQAMLGVDNLKINVIIQGIRVPKKSNHNQK